MNAFSATGEEPSGFLIMAWMRYGILCFLVSFGSLSAATHVSTLNELKLEGARDSLLRLRTSEPLANQRPEPKLQTFEQAIAPILKQHCVPCHGPEKTKARLRVDQLDPNLHEGSDVDWWVEVRAVLGNGEMPPSEESALTQGDRAQVMEWLSGEIRTASMLRRSDQNPSSFRRMTAYEYNYALQDLLGLPWQFARDLPPEARSEDGFKNSVEHLHMSVTQLESYRQLARQALKRATALGARPPALYWGVSMQQASRYLWEAQEEALEKLKEAHQDDPQALEQKLDQKMTEFKASHGGVYYKNRSSQRTARHSWSYGGAKYAIAPTENPPELPEVSDTVAILPPGGHHKLVVELGDQLPDEGLMRVRVRASRTSQENETIPSLQLHFGWQASNEGRALMRVSERDLPVDAPPEAPEFYQWDIPLGDIYPRNNVRKISPMGGTPSPSEHIRLVNSSVSQGDIQIDYVEIIAPYQPEWPPASHQRVFFDRHKFEEEAVYVRHLLEHWMPKMWRRAISEAELDRKLVLYEAVRPTTSGLEEAVIEVLSTVLSSPNFLYLSAQTVPTNESNGSSVTHRLTPEALATRLATFLWSSVPDEPLLELAQEGKLSSSEALLTQIKRMLADARSHRLAERFVPQWLDMELLDFLKPNAVMDQALKEAMQKEPVLFFEQSLRSNASLLDFIHADHTLVNERLARHYGIPDVHGNDFRPVVLKGDSKRGGILTQAGLLAMNASGQDSNPLKRGIWMLKNLLNDPPPPPPPTVPEIDLADPEIARMTLKERLADHRNQEACMSCHAKIDPWGIAFENFDAFGRWRDDVEGKPVDATSQLFNDQPLEGMDGLKRFLLTERQDQFVLAMTYKLCVYALGRPLHFSDHAAVEAIASQVRQQGDGLASLIELIGTSELFLSP